VSAGPADPIASLTPRQRETVRALLRERRQRRDEPAAAAPRPMAPRPAGAGVRFSVIFFAGSTVGADARRYQLLEAAARFADERGFHAVWTPERHFHDFGGLYPNPAVLGAAIAAMTERVRIHAGSVVLPLHHPIRVAEEWSVVDNLSGGRVGISCASGWHPDDFVLAPEAFAGRKDRMFEQMRVLRALWRGEAVPFAGPDGRAVATRIYPPPVQPDVPLWVTSSGSPDTWRRAARAGANVLTALLGLSLDELASRIALYREQLAAAGLDPAAHEVTVMLHTFIGEDGAAVLDTVREPMSDYLRRHLTLYDSEVLARQIGVPLERITEADRRTLINMAFERYVGSSSLIGTVDRCASMVERLAAIGVDEIACLVDFGVDTPAVLRSLGYVDELRAARAAGAVASPPL
jgi:natural product biosynthesis luciferase-like monooxygenase protein